MLLQLVESVTVQWPLQCPSGEDDVVNKLFGRDCANVRPVEVVDCPQCLVLGGIAGLQPEM